MILGPFGVLRDTPDNPPPATIASAISLRRGGFLRGEFFRGEALRGEFCALVVLLRFITTP